ncbi:MAG: ATP-binding cassette domain-containing protein, partial [Lachnospiraceae bacterium]|nr:ATP-binding cassette domain-containing protein [Lachnospiraceae bacterium]
VAFIFQKFELISGYTVYENVELPLRAKNIPKKERREKIMETLSSLGIENLKNKFPNKISGGEMQRVAIARAMVSGNDLILADEPTGSLDQKTGEGIIQILKRLNAEGKTIVVITHDPHIAQYGDRIVRIMDGKIEEE